MAAALIATEAARGAQCDRCGRRFPAVAAPERCSFCGSRDMTVIELEATGTVLAWTRVHRSRPASVLDAPYAVVHVQEAEPDAGKAAAFNCPLLGDGPEPELGGRVELKTARWQLDGGDEFSGIVAWRG